MNRALCWKEWREHRLIWLAVAALAVVLVPSLRVTLGWPTGGLGPWEREALLSLSLVLVVTYGLVCGGMTFAGEREAGTQAFLDLLTGLRRPVWRAKVLAGAVLTVGQVVVVLAALTTTLDLARDGVNLAWWALLLLVLGLNAYAAGLVASAVCRTALTAAGLGALFVAGSWLLAAGAYGLVAAPLPPAARAPAFAAVFLPVMALVSAGLVAGSRRLYCRTDRMRRYAAPGAGALAARPGAVRVLLWLTYRQGRLVVAGVAVVVPVAAGLLPAPGIVLWPVASLLLGLLCGVGVFLPEQLDGSYRLLADQRLPLGRVWLVKALCWLGAALVLGLLVFVAVVLHAGSTSAQWWPHGGPGVPLVDWLRAHHVLGWLTPPGLFLPMWLLYGFAAGLLCAQVFRKSVVAVLVALGLAAAYAGVWMPSLLLGGLHAWQALGVPVIFLVASRLLMRPWVAGRLLTWRPLLGLAGCGVLTLAWTAAGLCYRVAEVPDVGEPFDVRAFLAGIPTGKQNEAAQLLRQAAQEFREQRRRADEAVAPPKGPLFPEKGPEPAGGGAGGSGSSPAGTKSYHDQAAEAVEKGWPGGKHELGRWLDRLFEGPWVKDYRAAAEAPLGAVADPRHLSMTTNLDFVWTSREAAGLFVARALQLQVRGEPAEALGHLLTVLGVSRQVRNKAPMLSCLGGLASEAEALEGLRRWLTELGPRRELLRRALEGLTRHEEQTPPPSDWVKAEYFGWRNNLNLPRRLVLGLGLKSAFGAPEDALDRLAREAPWEKERERRLLDAVTAGTFFLVEHPREALAPRPAAGETAEPSDRYERLAAEVGLNAEGGPAAVLGARAWGKLLDRSELALFLPPTWKMIRATVRGQCDVRVARLQVALLLYQAEHGRPAKALEKLVPRYLAAVPVDPATGRPFHYRVSKGEIIPEADLTGNTNAEGSRQVRPGQGVLWCEGPQRRVFLVPLWAKR